MSQINICVCLLGTTPICDDIGRHVLNYGRRIPLAEWDALIDVSLYFEVDGTTVVQLFKAERDCYVVVRLWNTCSDLLPISPFRP